MGLPVALTGMKIDSLVSVACRLVLALGLALPAGGIVLSSPAWVATVAAPAGAGDKDKAAKTPAASPAGSPATPAAASPIPAANVVARAESDLLFCFYGAGLFFLVDSSGMSCRSE